MKKYKIWMCIEEHDEDEDFYQDVDHEVRNIGPEFDKLEEAIKFREDLLDNF